MYSLDVEVAVIEAHEVDELIRVFADEHLLLVAGLQTEIVQSQKPHSVRLAVVRLVPI